VRVDFHRSPQSYFLQIHGLRLRAVGLLLLGQFVLVLAEVKNAAYRRGGIGRDLDQVKTGRVRPAQGFDEIDDADLLIVFINQKDLGRANAVIDGRTPVVRLLRTKAAWTRDGLDPFKKACKDN
jgi:hypothetical protein